ncbi:MAG TPA: SAM-dependent methyltransferase, partial [Rhizomicrobium sp.]
MSDDLTNASERAAAQRLADALGLPAFEKGWVWLAGAGPGDPGLATALALHAIAHADVILYDALVNEALLKLARPGAELIYAGKRAGRKSCKQTDISRTLVSMARRGLRVLRLKGGDPFVFGRG